jgi:hypothetical protein
VWQMGLDALAGNYGWVLVALVAAVLSIGFAVCREGGKG